MQYWSGWPIPQPTLFFDSRLTSEHGLLDETFHYSLDYEWLIRVSQHIEFTCVDDILAKYRMHAQSKTSDWHSTKARFFVESDRVNRKYAPVRQPRYWPLWIAYYYYRLKEFAKLLGLFLKSKIRKKDLSL
jgi:hypothetical protein